MGVCLVLAALAAARYGAGFGGALLTPLGALGGTVAIDGWVYRKRGEPVFYRDLGVLDTVNGLFNRRCFAGSACPRPGWTRLVWLDQPVALAPSGHVGLRGGGAEHGLGAGVCIRADSGPTRTPVVRHLFCAGLLPLLHAGHGQYHLAGGARGGITGPGWARIVAP